MNKKAATKSINSGNIYSFSGWSSLKTLKKEKLFISENFYSFTKNEKNNC